MFAPRWAACEREERENASRVSLGQQKGKYKYLAYKTLAVLDVGCRVVRHLHLSGGHCNLASLGACMQNKRFALTSRNAVTKNTDSQASASGSMGRKLLIFVRTLFKSSKQANQSVAAKHDSRLGHLSLARAIRCSCERVHFAIIHRNHGQFQAVQRNRTVF